MPTYVPPRWPDPVFRDRAGAVIDYGSRWDRAGLPAPTASTQPPGETFLVADALIERLAQIYDVQVSQMAHTTTSCGTGLGARDALDPQ